jgi:hypothetical protein
MRSAIILNADDALASGKASMTVLPNLAARDKCTSGGIAPKNSNSIFRKRFATSDMLPNIARACSSVALSTMMPNGYIFF